MSLPVLLRKRRLRSTATRYRALGRRYREILLPLSFRWQPNIATTQMSTSSLRRWCEHFPTPPSPSLPRFATPNRAADTLDGALMLGAVIVSLLTQSDYFGLQQPVLLLERGMFLPQLTASPFRQIARWPPCLWRHTIADCLRRVPQKIAPSRSFLQTRSPNIYSFP